ncbi:Stk1 family PASTA domain-containing Ser/Thr kinase [Dactylosporangium roseum]|uniref:non-specific serine/threonine protein kinase n=1 Tax=Dactylosporangium roseum TaxID=47989 RepID=A0ABY5YZT8_9ACTN|nr:Stk1 family PASTA domain-containing Ser/Thr kinase [Dactylosporangium roseum]UWZ35275.1 Stk1 family PASTA domain-containing Ser/Thr kinase [Dactylosporangium roseum]
MDTTVADPLLGALVDGRYRVRARVAKGGMATVYTALDERLERTVALKIIHPAHSRDPQFVERFTDEAKTIARLTHPNVVAVYDQGTYQGLPYLVMEYVRGRTLREVLAERRRLQPQEALAVMEQMLAAIAAAHRAGLVHRDVKPENVLVAEPPGGTHDLVDGVVKVADFGLARAVEASADETGSHLMATVAYVAPELVTDGHADPRTDVYSAGIVLFEMLTGRVPYEADRPVEVAWQHVDRDVPFPSRYVPGLPPAIDDLVTRATRRDPGARPTDAGALLAEVQSTRDDIGVDLTGRSRPVAQPTVIVPRVESVPQTYQSQPQRPSWARLPGSAPSPARRRHTSPVTAGPGGRLGGLLAQVNASPRTRLTVIAAMLTLGLLVAIGGYWFGVGRYSAAPDLTQYNREQAIQQAQNSGFKVKFAEAKFDARIPRDKVLSQVPSPGDRILDGGTITITLSLGPEIYKVPDIAGKEYDLAVADIQAMKLVANRAERFDDAMPAGYVVATDPQIGTQVKPGQTVTLFVSKGPNPVKVPLVIGKQLDQAKQDLAKVKITVNKVEEVDSDKPKNEVVSQSIGDGNSVTDGMVIDLQVSKGPALVTVPEVRNMELDEARKTLQGMGFNVEAQGFGTVRQQDPQPGTQVPPGTTIRLFAFF